MTNKEYWFDYWGLTIGEENGERMWEDKLRMDAGVRLREMPMVFVRPDVHYQSPIDGRVIRSQSERIDDMRRNGCIEYDPEMKNDSIRKSKESDKALDSSIDVEVEKNFLKMPSAKKERLAAELLSGADVSLVRNEP